MKRIIIMFVIVFMLTGCVSYSNPMVNINDLGYNYETQIHFMKSGKQMYLAGASNKNVYNVNNVSLYLHFGVHNDMPDSESIYFNKEKMNRYNLYFGIYVTESDNNKNTVVEEIQDYRIIDDHYMIKELTWNELFETDKYACIINPDKTIKYNYKEKIIIPEEIFRNEEGFIKIYFYAFYKPKDQTKPQDMYKYYNHRLLPFEYKILEDGKVEISFDTDIEYLRLFPAY